PGIIKVADFGLAKAHDARSPFQTVCGTPFYMAPEVCVANAQGLRYDTKADSWSVGVTLAHM
ncbi:kinase-like domain-containing protein, partial [Cytidiella melzeri]